MILHGCALDKLKELDDNSIDCLVTDPPYGIEFMGKDWDKALPSIDIWKQVYRVLKPGSFGFVMCIPRQDCLSRMMISLEDAGFNINFSSLYWTYATGFPKAANVGKMIDKRLGKEREVVGRNERIAGGGTGKSAWQKNWKVTSQEDAKIVTAPASTKAKEMEGSYAGFQPKPAVEVIIVVMKPLSEKSYLDQAMKDGKGVSWFDDCRIPYVDEGDKDVVKNAVGGGDTFHGDKYLSKKELKKKSNSESIYRPGQKDAFYTVGEKNTSGRFPANLLISDDVLNDGKEYKSGSGKNKVHDYNSHDENFKSTDGFHEMKIKSDAFYDDSGGYSRFFSLDAWAERNLPFLIVPKASKKEKNAGCESLEEKQIYIKNAISRKCIKCGNKSYGTEGKCKCKEPQFAPITNSHPTVKPLQLKSYLITMGSREGDTIIDPFCGSGTTGCAAIMLNRKYILIEKESEYVEIAKARLKYYKKQPLKF